MPDDEDMSNGIPSNNNFSAIVADTLRQQASQFEAIIGGLQTQIENMNVQKTKKSKSTNTNKGPSSKANTLPGQGISTPSASRQGPRLSNSTPQTKSPNNPKTPTPTRKRHPLQVNIGDLPKDFKTCKDALFVHIKMMWGLYRVNDVPPAPDATLMQDFYLRFSSTSEVEAVVENPASADIISRESIITLGQVRASGSKGRSQLGRGLAHIDQTYILYIQGILAKVGIRAWCPNLNDTPDSLYNSACRITALNTFRQLLAGGAYNYMNVKLKYADSLPLMMAAYNHYVHYLMAKKYKIEVRSAGLVEIQNSQKAIQKNRERLRDSRAEFLLRHRAKYPACYRKVVNETLAHSNNEYEGAEITGKASRGRICKLPKVPVASKFKKVPRNLPLDFYDSGWFKALQAGQRRLLVNAQEVAFLPDASQSLMPVRHPNELLGDTAFTAKYLDVICEYYDISDEEEDVGNDDEQSELEDDSDAIDLDGTAEQDEAEEESDHFSEGNYGDLYDEDEAEECMA